MKIAKWINAQRNQNSYSLNYANYDREMAEVKNMSEKV